MYVYLLCTCYLAGIQPIPGIYTWLGGLVLIFGLLAILYGESQKEEIKEEQQQLQ